MNSPFLPSFPDPDLQLAQRLFDELDNKTRKGRGIVRDSYGEGEQMAHDIVRRAGEFLDLEVHFDAAQNLYLTIPGRDREAPPLIVGSHLDSVDQGGNFDGAAGVIAGMAAVGGYRRAGKQPPCDVTVMAIRGEESVWFEADYIGSNAAFGKLPHEDLQIKRAGTGKTLADHMKAAGCNMDAIRGAEPYLEPDQVRAFIEVHIEQGPVLVNADFPVAIVTGIRGCLRHRFARCQGEYGHSGALPRAHRRDAVAATTALIHRLNEEWQRLEDQGKDLVFTVGELTTDPANHGPSKVAGETRFVLDFRSSDEEVMRHMSDLALREARRLDNERGVTFDLGEATHSAAAVLDGGIRQQLCDLADALDLPSIEMASGAGHDAAVFANSGVPAGMIFIRNENSSHTPDEKMDMKDFEKATRLLMAYISSVFKLGM